MFFHDDVWMYFCKSYPVTSMRIVLNYCQKYDAWAKLCMEPAVRYECTFKPCYPRFIHASRYSAVPYLLDAAMACQTSDILSELLLTTCQLVASLRLSICAYLRFLASVPRTRLNRSYVQ